MSFETAYNAIKTRFTTEWAAGAYSTIQVNWQNEKNTLPDNPSEFLFVEVIPLDEEISAFGSPGSNEWDVPGLINIHVFVKKHDGAQWAWRLADAAAAIFRGQRFSGVTCYGAAPKGGEEDADDGNYWTVMSSVQFKYRFTG